MSENVLIAPSILGAKLGHLATEIAVVEKAGADLIHVDVMDGHFVPNITWGPPLVRAVRELTSLPLDVHLMIERPADFIQAFSDAGADIIGIHIEADHHAPRTLQGIRDLGKKACITLNPQTPLEAVDYVLPMVDQVLIMTVNPGFGSQKFLTGMVSKIADLRRRREDRGLSFAIEVDGGINRQTAKQVVAAGADILVSGAAIFDASDRAAQVHALRNVSADADGPRAS